MGWEYRIELEGDALDAFGRFLGERSDFTRDEAGTAHFGPAPREPLLSARAEGRSLWVCLHAPRRGADEILGALLRCLAAQGGQVAMREE